MRHSFIYSVLHLFTLTFFTAATPPACNKAQIKTCCPLDLNLLPAEEIPPESFSSSDEQIASPPATHKLIDPSRYTPQEPAANSLVFPVLRGPIPFAGVQSASSHGRDHWGYSLGQQSSSCRFSSTSCRKRKTSDSSAVSTSKRYKEGDPSNRYEPYNVINQHFSLKNSVSDVIPTSSKPGYVLPTDKNPTREAIGKIQEKELTVFTGLETNKKSGDLLNVYDWNFLREHPESEMANDHQHQYLRYLNQCKGESNVESFFFIERDRAKEFIVKFIKKSQSELNSRLGIHKGPRLGLLFRTLLKLSEKKIGLEGYPFFTNQIIEKMRQRLTKNLQNTQNPPSRPDIKTIVKFVRDVTKVTQLLIVVQLSLLKEHEKEVLTVEEVEKHLSFLQELWFQIIEGAPDMLQKDWAMKAHWIFTFQPHQKYVSDSVIVQTHQKYVSDSINQTEKMYHFCWNLVQCWKEKTERSLRGFYVPEQFPNKWKELVNRIIFFSNYQAQPSSFPKNPIKFKKRKFKHKENN